MTNLASFGSIDLYREVIMKVMRNKNHWRKTANLINNVRRQMSPHPFVDKEYQFNDAQKMAKAALRDTILPDNIKDEIKKSLALEFGFNFE